MKKNNLETFLDKYSLSGNIEAAKWIASNKTLATTTISEDKNIVVNVTTPLIDLSDGEYNVFQTSLLRKMLGVLDNEVTFKTKNDKTGTSFLLNDTKNKIRFALADPSVIPSSVKSKILPTSDLIVNLDLSIRTAFIKAATALDDEKVFTIVVDDKLIPQIVFGYDKKAANTNQIVIDLETVKHSTQLQPTKFSAIYLKSVFSINKEYEIGLLEFSTEGLLTISFQNKDFNSTYYLFEIVD